MSSFESSVSKSLDLKYHMRSAGTSIQQYLQTNSETCLISISTHLQLLSNVKDVSIFEPHATEVNQLLYSIQELMNTSSIASTTTLPWTCINVLACICRNCAAREVVMHTYEFVPPLSLLLDNQLSIEKKKQLLRLIQDLTCGIRIGWYLPHLNHLVTTLTSWLGDQQPIAKISLAILANLCYKNITAVHAVVSTINIKNLLKSFITSECPIMHVHGFKLMLSVENFFTSPPSGLLTLVTVAFQAVINTFRSKDLIELRQVVEFFSDLCEEHTLDDLRDNGAFQDQITKLVTMLNNSIESDEKCAGYVLKFLNGLVAIKLPAMIRSYPTYVPLLLKCIEDEVVAFEALCCLKTLINTSKNEQIFRPIKPHVPKIVDKLNWTDHPVYHMTRNKTVAAAVDLIRHMLRIGALKEVIVQHLRHETALQLLGNLAYDEGRCPKIGIGSDIEELNVQAHAVALVNEMAKCDMSWLDLQQNVLKNKHTYTLLAICILSGNIELKSLILELSNCSGRMPQFLAAAMVALRPVTPAQVNEHLTQSTGRQLSQALSTSSNGSAGVEGVCQNGIASVKQLNQIDQLIQRMTDSHSCGSTPAISDLMSLYECKLASAVAAERAAVSAADAAFELQARLQGRVAQLQADGRRLDGALVTMQRSNETLLLMKERATENYELLRKQFHTSNHQVNVKEQELIKTRQELQECQNSLSDLTKKFEQLEALHNESMDKIASMGKALETNESSVAQWQKRCQRKEETNKKLTQTVEELNSRMDVITEQLKTTEQKLEETNAELASKRLIIDTIMKTVTMDPK